MLQFLQPIWLLTAMAVTVPLLIHLWNLRKGKRLKIGSLLLITQSIQPTARQLRLTEWLLLLLRCLLILLLAALLAGPYWQSKTGSNKQKGWVLIPKESIQQIYPAFKPRIDSLLQGGYELHAFNFPFGTISADAGNNDQGKSTPYWQRLAQLNSRLPAGFPVAIFSEGNMEHFSGNRPDIALALQWQVLPNPDRRSQLVKATQISSDSIVLHFLETDAAKNLFTQQVISANTPVPGMNMLQTDSGRFVQWQQEAPVRIDTGKLRITIYQKTQQQDARYLRAALEAIRPLLDRPLQVDEAKTAASIPPKQDWVFWLSDEPITKDHRATNYFVYTGGETINTRTAIITSQHTSAGPAALSLYKRSKSNNQVEAIWRDGFGEVLLSKETGANDAGALYRFYSHFDPSWNNLVWQPSFPELILALLQNDACQHTIDLRQIDTAQLSAPTSPGTRQTAAIAARSDLSVICWWLLLVVFAAERWFSLYPKTKTRAA
jgi:hypothetical protein